MPVIKLHKEFFFYSCLWVVTLQYYQRVFVLSRPLNIQHSPGRIHIPLAWNNEISPFQIHIGLGVHQQNVEVTSCTSASSITTILSVGYIGLRTHNKWKLEVILLVGLHSVKSSKLLDRGEGPTDSGYNYAMEKTRRSWN